MCHRHAAGVGDRGTRLSARHPTGPVTAVAATLWVLTGWFFIAQVIVGRAWHPAYRRSINYISDLGAVHCDQSAVHTARYVCSPWHPAMDASFIAVGVLILAGAVLIRRALPPGRLGALGLGLVALAGAGLVVVGLFPSDVNNAAHVSGAAVQLVAGNVGMSVLGIGWLRGTPWMARGGFSAACGATGLAGSMLFQQGIYLGIGGGGMERVAVYPLFCWTIVIGGLLLVAGCAGDGRAGARAVGIGHGP